MVRYDFVVVGCGIFGAVFGRQMTEKGKKVLIIENRPHIGGNCYTENIEGIEVHKYGPHIFYTSDERVWKYINQFAEFNNFVNRVKVRYKEKLYSFPVNLMTLYQLWGVTTPDEARRKLKEKAIPNNNPQNLEEWALSQVGQEIYEIFFKGYTRKQWRKDPKDLPAGIIKRIPIRLNFDDSYYNARYQGIPVGGYAKLFERILDGIEVRLNTDYLSDRRYWNSLSPQVVYTGKIDEFFDYKFGQLEYRSLRFETKILNGDYQGNAVVNYTEEQVPFTRITEHKHFELKNCDKTVVTWEYPDNYGRGKVAYYPINDKVNDGVYALYKKEAEKQDKVIFGGRLATYAYLDMGQCISKALTVCEELP